MPEPRRPEDIIKEIEEFLDELNRKAHELLEGVNKVLNDLDNIRKTISGDTKTRENYLRPRPLER